LSVEDCGGKGRCGLVKSFSLVSSQPDMPDEMSRSAVGSATGSPADRISKML
jgi:hypothetical protein